jgi:hypothetical protein
VRRPFGVIPAVSAAAAGAPGKSKARAKSQKPKAKSNCHCKSKITSNGNGNGNGWRKGARIFSFSRLRGKVPDGRMGGALLAEIVLIRRFAPRSGAPHRAFGVCLAHGSQATRFHPRMREKGLAGANVDPVCG